MNYALKILVLFLTLTIIPKAKSFVEFHSHYGSGSGNPKKFNDAYYKNQEGPKMSKQSFLGFDAIARFSWIPIRVGLRYEILSEQHSDYGQKVTMTGNRFAGVVNVRFINEKQYLGLIGTYGLSHQLQIDLSKNDEVYKTSSGKSNSLGLEGGVKFGPLRLGAEIGQLFLNFSNLKDKSGSAPIVNNVTINDVRLTAPYYKLIVGFGF